MLSFLRLINLFGSKGASEPLAGEQLPKSPVLVLQARRERQGEQAQPKNLGLTRAVVILGSFCFFGWWGLEQDEVLNRNGGRRSRRSENQELLEVSDRIRAEIAAAKETEIKEDRLRGLLLEASL